MKALVLLLVLLAPPTLAQAITPGTAQQLFTEAQMLFAAPHGVTVNSASFSAGSVTGGCPGVTPETIQFGTARGFRGANGFVLSSSWVENADQQVPPTIMTLDPASCATATGVVGVTAPACSGVDLALSAAISGLSFTNDAAVYTIDFDAASAITYDLSYDFVTYENPASVTFFDSFAIFLDGTLIAGGRSNGGPEVGTDAWVLAPSESAPSEYNSLPGAGYFANPAYETGLRTISLSLPAGAHELRFHVADGSTLDTGTGCGESSDKNVDSLLFVGLHTFGSSNPGAHTAGIEIGRVGHPAHTGGTFPDDLQLTVQGVASGSILFLVQSPTDLAGLTIPLVAPLEFITGLAPYQLLSTQVAGMSGSELWPAVPPSIATTVTGDFFYQWWGLAAGGIFNSGGMRLVF